MVKKEMTEEGEVNNKNWKNSIKRCRVNFTLSEEHFLLKSSISFCPYREHDFMEFYPQSQEQCFLKITGEFQFKILFLQFEQRKTKLMKKVE